MSLLGDLIGGRTASRISDRDSSVFLNPAASAEAHQAIRHRLGWIGAPVEMRKDVPALEALARQARDEKLTDVYVLGMGGSSLCAEVLSQTAPDGLNGLSVSVLDTTDEKTIDETAASLVPGKSLFSVASKSGTTVEALSLERYFGSLMSQRLGSDAGRHFVAVTDPDTPLVDLANKRGYRDKFLNPADIGGRYSALSLFGLLPAALLGLDVSKLLAAGREMAQRCSTDDGANPGLALGAFMAESANSGRDKLTILLPANLAPLGAWIEQLIAESTGKEGRGILPVVDEPAAEIGAYAEDRAFVVMDGADLAPRAHALEAAGHPVFHLRAEALGAEFFRWEFATAVAGVGLGINPFDEPDVRSAKSSTKKLLDSFRATGALHVDPPLKPVDGVPGCLMREHHGSNNADTKLGRYVAMLDYLPFEPGRRAAMDGLRHRIHAATRMATTYGVGPRYLHSTGQYHKGGPNTGRFVLLTAADATMTPVPGSDYTFSVLKQAQALGDFNALTEKGRDVIHFHFEHPTANAAAAIEPLLLARFGAR